MEEAIRNFGQDRTPYAMLSRSVAGMYGDSLILALPGSTQGAIESMHALFPALQNSRLEAGVGPGQEDRDPF